jgi:putative ABC transport system ATP-binding protein
VELIIENISHIYKEGVEQLIFSDLSIAVKKPKNIAVVGPSGVGKTTLLQIISGIMLPSMGKVFYDEFELVSSTNTERTIFRRENIGMVFQDFRLFPELTIYENIILPMKFNKLPTEKRKERVEEILQSVDMLRYKSTFPNKLSGGQKQRIAMAIALANDPQFIFADEPTGNLDSETSRVVIDLLISIAKEKGKTLLICTHDQAIIDRMDEVWKIEDKIITVIDK